MSQILTKHAPITFLIMLDHVITLVSWFFTKEMSDTILGTMIIQIGTRPMGFYCFFIERKILILKIMTDNNISEFDSWNRIRKIFFI